MHIVVVHPVDRQARELRNALAAELSDASVTLWGEPGSEGADYAVGWLPPTEFFAYQPRLKAFFSIWAGVERILAGEHLPRSLPLIRLEDAGMGAQMARHCVCEVMRWMGRRDAYTDQQRTRTWQQLSVDEPSSWPIGVFGLGVLGVQVASAFMALGFAVNGFARRAHDHPGIRCFAESGGAGDFAAFMRASRVLILLAPLTPQTRDKFDRAALALLPPASYVINVARGDLLVDEAVIAQLDQGHMAGAALDVFRQEPLPPEHPFWAHPKIRVTPHVAAVTLLAPAARQIAGKIRCFDRGEPVSGVVQRDRGY